MARTKGAKWPLEVARRAGEAAWKLAVDHRARVEPRLAAGLIDGLRADLDTLRADTAGTTSARTDQHASTVTQNDAAAAGAKLVSAIREAVRDGSDDKALHKLFGVGKKVEAKKVSSVEGALQTVLDAGVKDAAGARAVGLLPADFTEAQVNLNALGSADTTQEGKKVTAQSSTASRDEVHARVEKAVGSIISAGILAFRGQPLVAELFRNLKPGKREAGASDKDPQADEKAKALEAEEEAKKKAAEKGEKAKD